MDLLKEVYAHQPSLLIDTLISKRLPLQEGAEKEMDEFINYISDRRSRLGIVVKNYYPWAKDLAIKIMETLVNEYHLK
jgi:hypothetical protein